MSKGILGLSVRLILSVSAVCIGLGAMGVDVVGMVGLSADMITMARYLVGALGVLSMYAFLSSWCSDCTSKG